VATFSDLSISRAATGHKLVAQASGLPSVMSTVFDISPGQKAVLVFSVQPGTTQVGAAISPAVRVAIQDAYGNVATSATDAFTASLGSNPRINRNGRGYTLQASASALSAATSTAFDITPGRAPRLVFRTTRGQLTAGEAMPAIEIELRDELDNLFTDSTADVTLSLGENATAAQLLGVRGHDDDERARRRAHHGRLQCAAPDGARGEEVRDAPRDQGRQPVPDRDDRPRRAARDVGEGSLDSLLHP
jgi:hypothetical protein